MIIGVFALSEFAGELAITESGELQSSLLAATLRIFSVFVVSLFIITSMVREFNDKEFELVLSLPIARATYYFGKLLGYSVLATVIAVLVSLVVLLHAPATQVLLWSASLTCELLIVAALSLLCMFTFNQITPAFSAVMAFYLLSRSVSAIQLIGHSPLVDSGTVSQWVINAIVDGIAFLLPNLDQFALTDWLIYHTGDWSVMGPILGQTVIYVGLLVAAALFDLYRKNL
ncbi:MAG: ABC transporter permease [Gammaproteobacteria bacterium]|nr:ABC transporter permease [Gammaproteobacteria bacterium]